MGTVRMRWCHGSGVQERCLVEASAISMRVGTWMKDVGFDSYHEHLVTLMNPHEFSDQALKSGLTLYRRSFVHRCTCVPRDPSWRVSR